LQRYLGCGPLPPQTPRLSTCWPGPSPLRCRRT
ncbi:hypothetical protein BN1708_018350, partial [Verticillium longisporum]